MEDNDDDFTLALGVPDVRRRVKNLYELARALEISRPTLDAWRSRPDSPEPEPNGTYDVGKWRAFKERLARERAGETDAAGSASAADESVSDESRAEAARREQIHKANILHLRELKMKGELVETSAVLEIFTRAASRSRAFAEKKCDELAGTLFAKDRVDIRETLLAFVDELFDFIRREGELNHD